MTIHAKLKATTLYGESFYVDIKVTKIITCLLQTVTPTDGSYNIEAQMNLAEEVISGETVIA